MIINKNEEKEEIKIKPQKILYIVYSGKCHTKLQLTTDYVHVQKG